MSKKTICRADYFPQPRWIRIPCFYLKQIFKAHLYSEAEIMMVVSGKGSDRVVLVQYEYCSWLKW